MKKQPEVTENIKSIIRDHLAMRPLMSVQKMRIALLTNGYTAVNGHFLDWHYVSKLMQKVRLENVSRLSCENRNIRLARLKERHRVITDALIGIVEGKVLTSSLEARYPTPLERVTAANVIMKWDTAICFAEENLRNTDDRIICAYAKLQKRISAPITALIKS